MRFFFYKFQNEVPKNLTTRKSSCVNERGIPTAAYQVLPEVGYPPPPRPGPTKGGVPKVGYPPARPDWGYPRWDTTPLGYPCEGTPLARSDWGSTWLGGTPTGGTLTGGPWTSWTLGTFPNWTWPGGYPDRGYPNGGIPPCNSIGPGWGVPQWGVPWPGGTPPQVPPQSDLGYLPQLDLAHRTPHWDTSHRAGSTGGTQGGVPPCQGTPQLDLAGVPLNLDLAWVPPPWCGQTDRHVSKHNLPVVLRTRSVKSIFN